MRRMNGIDGLRQCQHFYCVSCVTKPLLFLRLVIFQQSLLDPGPFLFKFRGRRWFAGKRTETPMVDA